jgi:hypothetical protein
MEFLRPATVGNGRLPKIFVSFTAKVIREGIAVLHRQKCLCYRQKCLCLSVLQEPARLQPTAGYRTTVGPLRNCGLLTTKTMIDSANMMAGMTMWLP